MEDNKNSNQEMRLFADGLWNNYFKQRVSDMLKGYISFYRAQVVTAASGGTVKVQKPFENSSLTLPYVPSAETLLTAGSQAMVLVLGEQSNAIVVGPPSLSNW